MFWQREIYLEIERKFLVASKPKNLKDYPCVKISQCYISKHPTIRIRQQNEDYILTVKGKGHLEREEFEMHILKEEYENLLKKAEPPVILKTRYLVPIVGGFTAEVDIFDGQLAGLLLVEVEFASKQQAEAFVPPEWFGEDVTFDYRYKNTNLTANIVKKISGTASPRV